MKTIEIEKEKIVKAFKMFTADKLSPRPELSIPCKQKGKYYASDAISLIMLPSELLDLDFEETTKPNFASVIPKEYNCSIEIKVSELEKQLIPEMIDEFEIIGKDVDCKVCEGLGEIEYTANYSNRTYTIDSVCPVCKGDGCSEKSFRKKTGKQIGDPKTTFKMLGVGFVYKELKRLVDTCNLFEIKTIKKVSGTEKSPNVFIVGNFTVLIMPFKIEGDYIIKEIIINGK